MNKLFGLFLLALAFLAPGSAFAAQCFWVGGTATWDTTNTGGGGVGGIKWASASGGASACAGGGTGGSPTAADSAVFDGSSGGGTVTVNFGGLITLTQIDFGAFTGTLDFATNNNSITLTTSGNAVFAGGAAVKTVNMGSGTWTLSGANGTWSGNPGTNLTLNANTSTLAFTGNGSKILIGGGKTFNNVTVAASSSTGGFISTTSAFNAASLTLSAPNTFVINQGFTLNITTLSVSGTSASSPISISSSGPLPGGAAVTLAVTNNFTGSWLSLNSTTFTTGTHTANSSFGFITSGITVNAPSAGGSGGGRIIGG